MAVLNKKQIVELGKFLRNPNIKIESPTKIDEGAKIREKKRMAACLTAIADAAEKENYLTAEAFNIMVAAAFEHHYPEDVSFKENMPGALSDCFDSFAFDGLDRTRN